MGWGAARKLHEVLTNTARVVAVEVVCAVQGLEHRRPLRPGHGTQAAADAVRAMVPRLESDRSPAPDIEAVAAMIEDGSLEAAVGR